MREHDAGGRAGRGLDPRRALPPGADRGRRRRHLGHAAGLDRRRLPGLGRGRDRRGGRGGGAAVRPAPPRDDHRHGRRRPRGGERRRRPRARPDADLRGARVGDRELRLPRHAARRRAHQRRDGAARRAGREPRPAAGGDRGRDRVRLPRDVHARPRRQRRRRDPRAARRLRRRRRPDRDRQHEGLHGAPDGRRPRGRPGGQGAGDRGRPAGAELPRSRPRAGSAQPLGRRLVPDPLRAAAGGRVRLADLDAAAALDAGRRRPQAQRRTSSATTTGSPIAPRGPPGCGGSAATRIRSWRSCSTGCASSTRVRPRGRRLEPAAWRTSRRRRSTRGAGGRARASRRTAPSRAAAEPAPPAGRRRRRRGAGAGDRRRARPAIRRTCSTWTSTSRPTWGSTRSSRPRCSRRSARPTGSSATTR